MSQAGKGQQLAAEYTMLAQLAEEVQKDIALLQNLLAEIDSAITTVKHLKELTGEEEVLVPLAGGVYARGRVSKQRGFLVSIGSNIIVEKSPEDTLKYLEERKKEVKEHLEKRTEDLNKILARIEEIRRAVAAPRK